jgi:excisionase family DNA binding protein
VNSGKSLPTTVINCKLHVNNDKFLVWFCLAPKEVHRMDDKPADILTIEELSAYLKIPKSTLYKVVRERKIPSQKVGRHWRFRKEAIDRWLGMAPAEKE